MSTVLSRNAHSNALKILAYVPATLTFVSRIYQDQHWTSDDFLGAAIGFLVGTWVVDLHEKKESAVNVSAIYPLTVSFSFYMKLRNKRGWKMNYKMRHIILIVLSLANCHVAGISRWRYLSMERPQWRGSGNSG